MEDQSCRFVARLSLLSKVGALAGTLDYEDVLSAVARLSIPELADWCIVDVGEDGEARRMEVAHRDPTRAPLAAALRAYPLDHAARRRLPAAQAFRSRQPVLIPDYTEEMLREQTEGDYLELARQLLVCSVLVIPVTLPSSLATMAFFMTAESGRRYGQEDVAVAEELVRRAAQLVENARVHQRLRQTEERFRVALAHSSITLFEQDAKGRYRWIYNPPFGYRQSDVVGKTNHDLLVPEGAARMTALDRAVLEDGERLHEEVRITLPGGDAHYLRRSRSATRRARERAPAWRAERTGASVRGGRRGGGRPRGLEPRAGDRAGAGAGPVRALRSRPRPAERVPTLEDSASACTSWTRS